MKKLRINNTLLPLFFIINTIITSYTSYPMDGKKIKIPAQHIVFLPNNILAIASHKSLIVYDLNKNEQIKEKKLSHPVDDIAINKTRSRLAVSCQGYAKQYTTETLKSCGEFFSPSGVFFPITFNSQKSNQLVIHDSCPDFSHSRLFFLDRSISIETYKRHTLTYITCHPHKAEIIYISSSERNQCFCSKSIATTNAQDFTISNNIDYYALEYQYSPNAHYTLINYKHGLHFQKSEEQQPSTSKLITCKKYNTTSHDPFVQFPSAIFYPNSNFFVTLSHQCILEYWDCETVLNAGTQPSSIKAYHSTPLYKKDTFLNRYGLEKRLSFSPDGTHLAIALPDKCLILPVPTSVIISSFDPELQKIILLLLSTKNKWQ